MRCKPVVVFPVTILQLYFDSQNKGEFSSFWLMTSAVQVFFEKVSPQTELLLCLYRKFKKDY